MQALRAADAVPAVQRLQWFTRGFVAAHVIDGDLVLDDLRMGTAPDYFFSYRVARRQASGWQPIPASLVHGAPGRDLGAQWDALWTRIWNEPRDQAAAGSRGETPAANASK